MPIEDPSLQNMATLCMGSFPRGVASFETSPDVFCQLIFVDYQIHFLLQKHFQGELYAHQTVKLGAEARDDVDDLKKVLESVVNSSSGVDFGATEALYQAVLQGHLRLLEGDVNGAYTVLEKHLRGRIAKSSSATEDSFLEYLKIRLCCLIGATLADLFTHWIMYLAEMRTVLPKSEVAARIWTRAILENVFRTFLAQAPRPLKFLDLHTQRFGGNVCAVVLFASFCLQSRGTSQLHPAFAAEFSQYLTGLLEEATKTKADFPNATQLRAPELSLMDAIFSSVSDITSSREYITSILKRKVSKRYLVHMAERSFQDHKVLMFLIQTLIDMKEYDEAFAAFATYVEYIQQQQTRNKGSLDDILAVIDVYTTCITAFNPANSFIPDAKLPSPRFKYRCTDEVVLRLKKESECLVQYLERASTIAGLLYVSSQLDESIDRNLAFLYFRFNPNSFIGDKSPLAKSLCNGWYAVGQFHSYLSTYETNSIADMKTNNEKILELFKKGLIVNCRRNVTHLFEYALKLAYSQKLQSAARLCKFILKGHPELFKTWNLLILALSGLETKDRSNDETAPSDDILSDVQSVSQSNLEKFSDDALNVASLYITKNQENGIATPIETCYDILQLKMTQLAILERNRGIEHMLHHVSEVFVLYKELFLDLTLSHEADNMHSKFESRSVGVWSHRPSVIDPSERAQALQRTMSLRKLNMVPKDSLKKPAKIEEAQNEGKETKDKYHEKELRILQQLWLWTASIYLKLDLPEEAEQCIVEAETADKPNVLTFTYLGLLTSRSRKFLALQEFERSLEVYHLPEEQYNKVGYALTLLGLCKLFIVDDDKSNSLFISSKDHNAGLVRLKNYLEEFSHCWPYGYNNSELWYYLSGLYQKFDDKILYKDALWRCVELEDWRPVRSFDVCEGLRF